MAANLLGNQTDGFLVTLRHALRRVGKADGVASLCVGVGEATALAVEMVS